MNPSFCFKNLFDFFFGKGHENGNKVTAVRKENKEGGNWHYFSPSRLFRVVFGVQISDQPHTGAVQGGGGGGGKHQSGSW